MTLDNSPSFAPRLASARLLYLWLRYRTPVYYDTPAQRSDEPRQRAYTQAEGHSIPAHCTRSRGHLAAYFIPTESDRQRFETIDGIPVSLDRCPEPRDRAQSFSGWFHQWSQLWVRATPNIYPSGPNPMCNPLCKYPMHVCKGIIAHVQVVPARVQCLQDECVWIRLARAMRPCATLKWENKCDRVQILSGISVPTSCCA
jgi:hypothetical protein